MNSLPDWQGLAVQVQSLSQEMLELARAGEWEAVTEREERRRNLIEDIFSQPLPAAAFPVIATPLSAALASNQSLLTLGQQTIGELCCQIEALAQGRKASLTYAEFEE